MNSKTNRPARNQYRRTENPSGRVVALAAILLGALAASGCYSKPLGVMASEDPAFKGMDVQLVEARLKNFLSDHGTITLALPNGENCHGKWAITDKRFAGVRSDSLLNAMGDLTERNVAIVGNGPGSRNGKASLYCHQGTTVEMDFVTRRGTADGYGVARDSGDRYYLIDFGWP